MATYYRWRRSTARREPEHDNAATAVLLAEDPYEITQRTFYFAPSVDVDGDGENQLRLSGTIDTATFHNYDSDTRLTDLGIPSGNFYFAANQSGNSAGSVAYCNTSRTYADCVRSTSAGTNWSITSPTGTQRVYPVYIASVRDEFLDYVYSTSSSAYPNGGVSGSYYYDQRTTVTSPTAPTGLTYPNPITTPTVTVSWNAATSNTDYPVKSYYVSAYYNGSLWETKSTSELSRNFTIPTTINGAPVTSAQYEFYSKDTNGQSSEHVKGPNVPVYFSPTLTVPQMVMQGQSATVSWTAIDGADSYTLQRKANTDADWTQVYSGANQSYSETVGTWTSVQYRVQAVFSGTPGGWAESAAIPVVSSSALVISGTDGDLGTVVNDIPYSISTDTGNQITATITVNSAVIFSGNVGNSTSDTIPVLDLVNGTGTIVIEATVTSGSAPVSAVRTWTYTKAPITFPNAGSVAQLT